MSAVKEQVIGRGTAIRKLVVRLGFLGCAFAFSAAAFGIERQPVAVHQLMLDEKGHYQPTDRSGELRHTGNFHYKLDYEDALNGGRKVAPLEHPELNRSLGLMNNGVVKVSDGDALSYAIPVQLMIDLVPETPQLYIWVQYLTGPEMGEYIPVGRIMPAPQDAFFESPMTENDERPRWVETQVDTIVTDERTGVSKPHRRNGYLFLNMNPRISRRHPVPKLLFYYTVPVTGGYTRYEGKLVDQSEYNEAHVILSVPQPLVLHPENEKILTANARGIILDVTGEEPHARLNVQFRGEPLKSFTVPVSAVKGTDGLLFCKMSVAAAGKTNPAGDEDTSQK